ncbi:hypothetical protein M0804_003781 [Polistes exclamans]|nr:hypothetical protein M0804_003781 [Polistes exclamans]
MKLLVEIDQKDIRILVNIFSFDAGKQNSVLYYGVEGKDKENVKETKRFEENMWNENCTSDSKGFETDFIIEKRPDEFQDKSNRNKGTWFGVIRAC